MARIMVIDDDPATLLAARALLERLGHEVVTADSGSEGVESAVADAPDMVLTDIFMPFQDGLETLRRLKREVPGLPVVCMSAGPRQLAQPNATRDAMLRFARHFGADASLTKPLHPADLKAVLATVLA
ncbi:MAG TPA: response regulator [Azospirillum sp.]